MFKNFLSLDFEQESLDLLPCLIPHVAHDALSIPPATNIETIKIAIL
jgi:hypothetical protein